MVSASIETTRSGPVSDAVAMGNDAAKQLRAEAGDGFFRRLVLNDQGKEPTFLSYATRKGQPAHASRLEKLGHEVTTLCLSKIEHLDTPFPDADYDGVILTSARAPNILKNYPDFTALSNLPVFCVGTHTANQAVTSAGFSQISDQEKDAASLAQTLVNFGNSNKIIFTLAPKTYPLIFMRIFWQNTIFLAKIGRFIPTR